MRKSFCLSCLFLVLFITGCSNNTEDNSKNMQDLISNQNKITMVEIIQGGIKQKGLTIDDDEIIQELLGKIEGISLTRLKEKEDNEFMYARIQDDSLYYVNFHIEHDESRFFPTLVGNIFTWSDGYIYVVDIDSMAGDERTIAYLSAPEYEDIYAWLSEQWKWALGNETY